MTVRPLGAAEVFGSYARDVPLALALVRTSEILALRDAPLRRPIVDLGCGDGIFASRLVEFGLVDGFDLGIDLNADELAAARDRGVHASLRLASIDRTGLPDGSYVTAFSNCVCEHIFNVEDAFREVARILRPGGHFILTVPTDRYGSLLFWPRVLDRCGLRDAARRYARGVDRTFRHYHTYDRAGWTALLDRAGFDLVSSRPYLPPRAQALFDLLLLPALPSVLLKKTAGRWTLSPGRWRRLSGLLPWSVFCAEGFPPDVPHAGLVLVGRRRGS